jgi:hypothetical protein
LHFEQGFLSHALQEVIRFSEHDERAFNSTQRRSATWNEDRYVFHISNVSKSPVATNPFK